MTPNGTATYMGSPLGVIPMEGWGTLGLIVSCALGILGLYAGGEFLCRGASGIALRFKVSRVVIGLTIVAVATSLPELVTSVISVLRGIPDLAVGNLVGSNLANIGLILPLAVLILPFAMSRSLVRREIPLLCVVTVLFVALAWGGGFGVGKGLILVLGFVGFMIWVFRVSRDGDEELVKEWVDEVPKTPMQSPLAVLAIILGGFLLWVGAEGLVGGGSELARRWGVSEAFIGLTLVAVGTSLPELAASIVAASKGESELAAGNIIGSNVMNLLLIAGVTAVTVGLPVSNHWFGWELGAMIVQILVLSVFLWFLPRMNRWTAVLHLLLYGIIVWGSLYFRFSL